MTTYDVRKDGEYLWGVWDITHGWWYAQDLLREEADRMLIHASQPRARAYCGELKG